MQQMKEFIKSKYAEIFAAKQLDAGLQEEALEFLCSEKLEEKLPPALAKLEFTGEDLTVLAEVLSVVDSIFLRNFLLLLLRSKKFESLTLFFSKVFVSHIGKTPYQSKKASSFDIRERTFDRFIEATIWTEIDFPEFAELLFTALRVGGDSGVARWRRPSEDYISALAISREKEFFNFIFENFDNLGMTAFEFLLSRNSKVALKLLIEHYLSENFPQKRQVKNILKQRFSEVLEVMEELQKSYKINLAQTAELMLILPQHPHAKTLLSEIYRKEKDPGLKKRIAENVELQFESEVTSLPQLKKLSQRFDPTANPVFLGRKLSDLPKLKFKNKEEATDQVVGYMLERYAQLYSPAASGELKFFKGFFAPDSMDAFCRDIATLITAEEQWAIIMLAQNCSLTAILPTMSALKNQTLVDSFAWQFVIENGTAVFTLFDTLDKANRTDRQVLDALLRPIMQSGRFEPMEVEILRDKMVPQFELNPRGELDIDGVKLVITENFTVEVSGAETKLSKKANIEKKRLQREVERQLKRLKNAFECGRTWTPASFEKLILQNRLMNFLGSKLLWARYRKGALLAVFKITEKGVEDLLSLDKTSQDFVVGIFHPVENTEQDWLELFGKQTGDINQFGRETFNLASYNPYSSLVTRFNGMIVQASQFFDRLGESGWNFGPVSFNGSISSMFKINRELNLLCQIDFSPIQKNCFDANLSLGELRFYRLNTVLTTGNNFITDKTTALELGTLPKRWFSDIIRELTIACRK